MEGFRMAEAGKGKKVPAAQAYFTTSYAFNTSTTSTAYLMIWRALSERLEQHQLPMTGAELSKATGLTLEQIESPFSQVYYRRYYGFRRFDTLEDWRAWAEGEGVLYVPALHDPKPVADDEDDDLDGEDEEADDETETEEVK
jgi:hypothetical protein